MHVTPEWLKEHYWDAERILAENPAPAGARAAAGGLVTSRLLEGGAGSWRVEVTGWRPVSDNLRARGMKAWYRGKRRDREVVRDFVLPFVPGATGRRRVGLHVEKRGGQRLDESNLLKSFLDALVECGLLLDDGAACEKSIPVVSIRGDLPVKLRSVVMLEDIRG